MREKDLEFMKPALDALAGLWACQYSPSPKDLSLVSSDNLIFLRRITKYKWSTSYSIPYLTKTLTTSISFGH